MSEHPHAPFIRALGGYRALAGDLSLHPHRVHHWLSSGIPPRRWPQVLRLAASKAVSITWQDLDATGAQHDYIALKATGGNEPVSGNADAVSAEA